MLGDGAFVADEQGGASREAVLSSSRPLPDGDRWGATTALLDDGTFANGAVTVWAICADVTP